MMKNPHRLPISCSYLYFQYDSFSFVWMWAYLQHSIVPTNHLLIVCVSSTYALEVLAV